MRAALATSVLLFVFALLLHSQVGPASTSTPPISERLSIVSESASKTDAYPEIEELCDLIGPRLTGSVGEAKAEQLMLGRMRDIGLSRVHAESWELPRSWHRGPATASLVTPFSLPIPVAAYGWTGSTQNLNGPSPVFLLHADDIAEHLDALVHSQGASWNGKILLVSASSSKPMRAYAGLFALVQAATGAHAIAVLRHDTRPGVGLVHSEPLSVVLPDRVDSTLIRTVAIGRSLESQRRVRTAESNRNAACGTFTTHACDCAPRRAEQAIAEEKLREKDALLSYSSQRNTT